MPDKPLPPTEYAAIKVTHHALSRERASVLRARPGRRSTRPECLIIGHAWTEDPAREGGTICIACQVVRLP
ncbi:MAG: hypothetical protein M3N26_07600 [Pseudomonadota bacterium]|nr:hypothetical protein [Pseudomonadota bacterium]